MGADSVPRFTYYPCIPQFFDGGIIFYSGAVAYQVRIGMLAAIENEGDTEMAEFRGVILDVDGTLVDSNDQHAHAWVDALTEFGYNVPYEPIRKMIGMGSDRLLRDAVGVDVKSEQGQAISKRVGEIFMSKYLPQVKAFPGTHALLQHMHDQGLQLAVASSAKKDELDALLKLAGAEGLIEDKTAASDVQRSKPAPDVVEATLEKLELPRTEVVMLGDTPYDVEACQRAGVKIIAFRSGGWDDPALHGAIAIYDGPADLLAHYEQSPLA